jgi:hypothetical protein
LATEQKLQGICRLHKIDYVWGSANGKDIFSNNFFLNCQK